jgi:hypothetical protein
MENYEINVMGLDEIEAENTSIDEIDSEVVNLIFVGIDASGSMSSYVSDMKGALKDFKDALSNSKEADEILVARADFESTIDIGGYKKITEFDTSYSTNDMTRLYDTVVEGTDKLFTYMNCLKQQGMRVKAVFAIFSDGCDNYSNSSVSEAREAIKKLNDEEITTAFISFGSSAKGIAKSLDFKNELSVGGSASELRKAFNCLSKSVIESSKAVLNNPEDFFQM